MQIQRRYGDARLGQRARLRMPSGRLVAPRVRAAIDLLEDLGER